jgi:Acetoacetate decarboxylase (ADC)
VTIDYLDRGGEQTYRPPYTAEGVRFYSFLLEADPERLRTFLDTYFNNPSANEVQLLPAIPYVLLNFTSLACLRSVEPPDSAKGWTTEKEVSLFVLALDVKRERLVQTCPYMYVDTGYAMASGREAYGFPKQIGWVTLPKTEDEMGPLTLDTIAIRQFSRDSEQTRMRLIDVECLGGVGKPLETTWGTLADLCRDVGRLAVENAEVVLESPAVPVAAPRRGSLGLLTHAIKEVEEAATKVESAFSRTLNIAEEMGGGILPILLLKQFRAADQPGTACYQAIVETALEMTYRAGGILPGDYRVTISDAESQGIRQDLGLGSGPLEPTIAYWTDVDFRLREGTEIWNAATHNAPTPASPRS